MGKITREELAEVLTNELDGNLNSINGINTQLADLMTNAKNKNAKGDNVTDDTTALQNLFDTSVNPYLPQGTFIISSPLSLQSFSNIKGVKGKTFIKVVGNINAFSIIGKENITIDGITFLSEDINISGITAHILQSKHIKFENCEFYGFGDNIWIGENPTDGTNTFGSRYIIIEKCNFYNTKVWAIYIRGLGINNNYEDVSVTKYVIINNCNFYNINCSAINTSQSGIASGWSIITNCTFDRCAGGIIFEGTTKYIVNNILMNDIGKKPDHFTNDLADPYHDHAIMISYSDNIKINNVQSDSGELQINCNGTSKSKDCQISDSKFKNVIVASYNAVEDADENSFEDFTFINVISLNSLLYQLNVDGLTNPPCINNFKFIGCHSLLNGDSLVSISVQKSKNLTFEECSFEKTYFNIQLAKGITKFKGCTWKKGTGQKSTITGNGTLQDDATFVTLEDCYFNGMGYDSIALCLEISQFRNAKIVNNYFKAVWATTVCNYHDITHLMHMNNEYSGSAVDEFVTSNIVTTNS